MPALTIQDLTFPEQLLVWSLRRWLTARQDWPVIRRELQRACGGLAGYAAAQAVAEIIELLGVHGARPVGLNPLCCRRVSADEMRVITLIAASQTRDGFLTSWIAAELVTTDHQEDLVRASAIVADAFQTAGRELPPRFNPTTNFADAILH